MIKIIQKTSSIQIAGRNSYKIIAIITILFTYNIWHDCIVPQKKNRTFNISNSYFSKYKMCRFSQARSHMMQKLIFLVVITATICDCISENPPYCLKYTEINFLTAHESYTHALPETPSIDGQVCFYRQLFSTTVKPQGCILWLLWPLRGINRTAWGD